MLGYIVAFALLLGLMVPTTFRFMSIALDELILGGHSAGEMVDAAFLLFFNLAQLVLAFVLWRRRRRQNATAKTARKDIT